MCMQVQVLSAHPVDSYWKVSLLLWLPPPCIAPEIGIRVIGVVFPSQAAIESFIVKLSKHFKLHDLGTTTQLLRMKIDRDHSCRSLSLSQQRYTIEGLQNFGMVD